MFENQGKIFEFRNVLYRGIWVDLFYTPQNFQGFFEKGS